MKLKRSTSVIGFHLTQSSRRSLTHLWKWFPIAYHLQGMQSCLSPFQGSMEAEENSPSASTPASPQTKTASEGELSTTAAELLQDYMTTVRQFHFLSISLLRDSYIFLGYTDFVNLVFPSPFSCGQNCHHRKSSSLPPCFMNTATVHPSMSSALTCGSSMGTAGSSFYLVGTLYFPSSWAQWSF